MIDNNLATIASRAYGAAAGLNRSAPDATDAAASTAGPDFGAMVKEAAQHVSAAGGDMEQAMRQASLGQADLIDIVTAVAAAETSLETVIAVRDQFIKAYQEVMRMPI